jgi:ferredoxin
MSAVLPATHAFAAEARALLDSMTSAWSRIFCTDEAAGTPDKCVTHGHLDRNALADLNLPTESNAYVCGPAGFMDAMAASLADLGLAPSRIHTEIFASLSAINPGVVSADRPAPHAPARSGSGPAVTFARAGITAAFDEESASLLEFAEACDVPTRWSCRTGVCHTCTTPLLSGEVTYFLAPLTEPESGHVLLCCSRPTTETVLDL